ncbi:MAG: acyl-CoA dehydrogenase family protein [Candidatus Rokubacteria bacterium]|nr:acyl-CoA dehydrogenase family protein [Candidatus Rokubacteria bacterium]
MSTDSRYFSEDHELFRKHLREFVLRELAPHADEWERAGLVPREVFRRMGALGYLGIRFRPEYGGSGLDHWYTVVLCEELMRSLSVGIGVSMLVQSEFATAVLHDEGPEELRRALVPAAVKGETIWALGVTEPGFGSNVAGLQTTARREGGDYVINGSKIFISNGTRADFITLAVRTGGQGPKGISLIVFPTDTKGFSVGRALDKLGARASDTAELSFDGCRVPARNLIGEEGKGFQYILDHFQGERLVLASFANGFMQVAWEEALKYGRAREVFGKAILQHQVWRHRLADIRTQMEASRQLTYYACDRMVTTGKAHKEISMAKLFATETVKKVVGEVFQLHGGYANIEEFPICRLYRDVSGFTIGAGTSEIMREIIAAEERL